MINAQFVKGTNVIRLTSTNRPNCRATVDCTKGNFVLTHRNGKKASFKKYPDVLAHLNKLGW